MHQTPSADEGDGLKPLTPSEATELIEADHAHGARFGHPAAEQGLRENFSPGNRVTWVRVSDLVNSGTGRIAGRGIDFEAELARRLRHPAEVTRRAIRNRSSSLPPLDAFGRSRSGITHDALGRR